MVMQGPPVARQRLQIPQMGIPGMTDGGTKHLIGGILAATTGDCQCDACKHFRLFAKSLNKVMLAEDDESGNQNTE